MKATLIVPGDSGSGAEFEGCEIEPTKDGTFVRAKDRSFILPDGGLVVVKKGRLKGNYVIARNDSAEAWGPRENPPIDAMNFDKILRTRIVKQIWETTEEDKDWKDFAPLLAAGVAGLAVLVTVVAWLDNRKALDALRIAAGV